MRQLAEPKLIIEAATPVEPARVYAHTAQLPIPRPAPKPSGKPLFPVDLPTLSSVPPTPAGSKPVPTGRAQLAATRVKPPSGPARRAHLTLAPSAAEIRREIAARNGGPDVATDAASRSLSAAGAGKDKPTVGARLEDQATAAPNQRTRWPTHVDYSAGPMGPAGGNTAGDRKGALIEATGPQQGVIRNRW
jgi:hypothetical protein